MKKSLELLRKKAYLYCLSCSGIKIHEGAVYKGPYPDEAVFKTYFNDLNFACSLHPGAVSYSVLWLSERNDEQAKRMFMAHRVLQIQELQGIIDEHLKQIDIIKNETIKI